MNLPLLGSLLALALIDSTSFGTLLIPIWLLLHPGPVRPGRILVFLATVATFYFAVGLALAFGASAIWPHLRGVLDSEVASWIQLAIGVALFILSFRMGGKHRRGRGGPSRLHRWRERALAGDQGIGGLVGLALAATAVELGTMLPYLAAIGLITAAGLTIASTAVVMAGYCVVMVAPALGLLGLRLVAGHRIEPLLKRISDWMSSSEALAWVVGIVGFLLARDAAVRLDLLGMGGS